MAEGGKFLDQVLKINAERKRLEESLLQSIVETTQNLSLNQSLDPALLYSNNYQPTEVTDNVMKHSPEFVLKSIQQSLELCAKYDSFKSAISTTDQVPGTLRIIEQEQQNHLTKFYNELAELMNLHKAVDQLVTYNE